MSKAKAKKVSKKSSKRVTCAQFVEVYQAAKTVDEAAKKLGITVSQVRQKASIYRGKGLTDLKKFPRTHAGPRPIDWAAMNTLAKKNFVKPTAVA